jgi:hypothetical protein
MAFMRRKKKKKKRRSLGSQLGGGALRAGAGDSSASAAELTRQRSCRRDVLVGPHALMWEEEATDLSPKSVG